MGQRLVSPCLLRQAPSERGGPQPPRSLIAVRSGRAWSRQARTPRRLVPLHRSVLFAIHGGHAREGRSRDGDESPRSTGGARASTAVEPSPHRRRGRRAVLFHGDGGTRACTRTVQRECVAKNAKLSAWCDKITLPWSPPGTSMYW